MKAIIPAQARQTPRCGPHSRYTQIQRQGWSDAVEWVHHSAPRRLPLRKEGAIRVLDVHDNVGALIRAYARLAKLPAGSDSRTSPQEWGDWWREEFSSWIDDELMFITDRDLFDIVVCINENDATTLAALRPNVFYLPFVPTIVPQPEKGDGRGSGGRIVALSGAHDVALNGVYGFAREVGEALERISADVSIRLELFGDLAALCGRMGMEEWLRKRRVDLMGIVESNDVASVVFGSDVRAAVILGIIPSGAKTQVATSMSYGISPIGLTVCAGSTPLELEWAERGACQTWDEMVERLTDASVTAAPKRSEVNAALAAFESRALQPNILKLRALVKTSASSK